MIYQLKDQMNVRLNGQLYNFNLLNTKNQRKQKRAFIALN